MASEAVTSLLGGQQVGVAFDHKVGRRLIGFRHVLGDLAHAPLGGDVVLTRVFVQVAVEQGKQRRLARAVAPHQADFFAGVQGDGCAFQQDFGASAKGDVFKSNQGNRFGLRE